MQRNEFLFNAILASMLFATAPMASAAPNFSGNWKMNLAKTDTGPMPAPEKYEQKIDHKDPSLKSTVNQVGQMGEFTYDLTYTTDGAECVNKIRGNDVKGNVVWEGEKLKFSSKMNFQGADVSFLEKWTISADGKVLTIERHITSSQGEIDVKLVFDKQ